MLCHDTLHRGDSVLPVHAELLGIVACEGYAKAIVTTWQLTVPNVASVACDNPQPAGGFMVGDHLITRPETHPEVRSRKLEQRHNILCFPGEKCGLLHTSHGRAGCGFASDPLQGLSC